MRFCLAILLGMACSKGGGEVPFEGAPAEATVLDGAWIVDASGGRMGAVVLSGESIWEVLEPEQDWPEAWVVEDLSGKTVMPGLIDSHVHLYHSGSTVWIGDSLEQNLAATLAWGVVAVVDLGGPEVITSLRNRIADGSLWGPRMLATGPFLTAVGSHPCERFHDRELCRFVDGDGVAQAQALAHSDLIKVALADYHFSPWPTPRLALGDLEDILSGGKRVVAHVSSVQDFEEAAGLGVAYFAHPPIDEDLDEEALAVEFKALSTTLAVFERYGAMGTGWVESAAELLRYTPQKVRENWAYLDAHPNTLLAGSIAENAKWALQAAENLRLFSERQRPLVAGSDAGYYFLPHGAGLHMELESMVHAGFSPLEAITAATSLPAEVWGWSDLGRVEAGYRADLLVLGSDPLQDILATRDIEKVLLGGLAHDPEELGTGSVWISARPADEPFCLVDADCEEACSQLDHICVQSCDAAWQVEEACDSTSWCAPADGFVSTTEGACIDGDGCDWRAQDCAPTYYKETCVPADLDSSYCWPAGNRGQGQVCGWDVNGPLCDKGLYCSPVSGRCLTLCDPSADDPGCPIGTCQTQLGELGSEWFGLCY
jgi:imidazolonepropionase-like amidohydrolase